MIRLLLIKSRLVYCVCVYVCVCTSKTEVSQKQK